MTRDQLLEKSLGDLREIAKLQGVKSITKYRKGELVDIIMNGGSKLSAVKPKAEAEEKALAAKYEEGIGIGFEKGRDEGIGIGMERGREEGIEIGVEKGRYAERREMAKALKNNGASLDLIANVSSLSE